ncbi:MAG: sigma-70 family RNA polymerase sigma factor [Candidatus Marinimicrobia bacterium]|nr:sigma-70 family RNA polymerase sigma factor [Candidatus Neomarinimicrobiota bacterium]
MNYSELIKSSTTGDHQAFQKLVESLEPLVASTVIGMLGNSPEAEDVGQETFIRLYKSLSSFKGDSSIETYVTRIAINLSINELKKRKRRSMIFKSAETDIDLGNLSDHKNPQDEEANRQLIEYGLKKLKPDFKAVIVLRLINGYSVKETSKVLNVAEGTVLSRLARAQGKLRKILTPLLGDHRG